MESSGSMHGAGLDSSMAGQKVGKCTALDGINIQTDKQPFHSISHPHGGTFALASCSGPPMQLVWWCIPTVSRHRTPTTYSWSTSPVRDGIPRGETVIWAGPRWWTIVILSRWQPNLYGKPTLVWTWKKNWSAISTYGSFRAWHDRTCRRGLAVLAGPSPKVLVQKCCKDNPGNLVGLFGWHRDGGSYPENPLGLDRRGLRTTEDYRT